MKSKFIRNKVPQLSNQMGCQEGVSPTLRSIYLKRNASKAVNSLKNADEQPYTDNALIEMKEYGMFVKVFGNIDTKLSKFQMLTKIKSKNYHLQSQNIHTPCFHKETSFKRNNVFYKKNLYCKGS